jgi:hypothetical protein
MTVPGHQSADLGRMSGWEGVEGSHHGHHFFILTSGSGPPLYQRRMWILIEMDEGQGRGSIVCGCVQYMYALEYVYGLYLGMDIDGPHARRQTSILPTHALGSCTHGSC